MALPNVFRVLGIIPATVTLLTVYALTHLSLNLLLRCVPYRSAPSTRTHAPPTELRALRAGPPLRAGACRSALSSARR